MSSPEALARNLIIKRVSWHEHAVPSDNLIHGSPSWCLIRSLASCAPRRLSCSPQSSPPSPPRHTPNPPRPLKVCILSGCETYHSEKSLPPFQNFLEENYNAKSVRVSRQAEDDLPGLELLDECDVALIFIKRMQLKGDQLDQFKKYATSGRPLVAVRTASHAVQTWLEFDREVLGGKYQGHYDRGITTNLKANVYIGGEKSHPILRGVEIADVADPLYKNSGHAEDIDILLTGTIPDHPAEPVAWTRQYKKGRLFYTSLGAEETFAQEWYRRMLANALFWTARRDVEARE